MASQITCPHCDQPISLDEALTSQIKSGLESELKAKSQAQLEQLKKNYEAELASERKKLAHEMKHKIEEEASQKLTLLEKDIAEKKEKLRLAQEREFELLKKEEKLEEAQRTIQLEMARQLEDERKKIRERTEAELIESQRLKDMQKEKVITDLRKALEDAQRKANQGSQQTQGEVVELELEKMLTDTFRDDLIEPVGKGVSGADVRQVVRSSRGTVCGVMLWESKQTKAWSEGWIGKLKTDLRASKADIPIIVTTVYNEPNWCGITFRDGVWITDFARFIPLAMSLRKSLLDVGREKAMSQNRGEKADLIYNYVTSQAFRQQIEATVEVFYEMQTQIQKERAAMERIWKAREGQAQRILMSMGTVYGNIQGLAGSSAVPELKGLELDNEETNEPGQQNLLHQ